MQVLKDKVVVVTGAGQGIGRAIALQAAQAGAKVVVNDIGSAEVNGVMRPTAEAVAEEIRAAGGQALAVVASISERESCDHIVAQALEAFGQIDSVINNAGILRDRMFYNMDDAEWDAVVKVHLYGYYYLSRAVAPHFKERNSGNFVHFSSASALIGNKGQSNYAAAKMGVVGLSTGIALDMARFNVRSNVVAPWAWSALVASVPIRDEAHAERMRKIREGLRPEQVAPLCVFLASDAAASVSGQIFGVRGNEIYLFSQPRILRSVQKSDGWTPESLAQTMLPTMASSFYPVQPFPELINWDPI